MVQMEQKLDMMLPDTVSGKVWERFESGTKLSDRCPLPCLFLYGSRHGLTSQGFNSYFFFRVLKSVGRLPDRWVICVLEGFSEHNKLNKRTESRGIPHSHSCVLYEQTGTLHALEFAHPAQYNRVPTGG